MVRLKKVFFLVGIMMLVLVLFTGCSSDTSTTDDTTNNDANNDSEEEVTLRMIESITSPARTELLKEMIGSFEDENPHITVELISPPLQSADEKISQMLMAEEDIDVLEVREQTVKQWSNNDFIEDLSSYTAEWEDWETLTETIKYAATAIDDTPYYIPYGVYEKTLFYRVDWFEEAGIDVPTTWDELADAAVKLTDPTINRFGYSFRGGAGTSDYIEFMTWSYLGDKVVQDDAYFTKDGDTIFDTPEAKQVLEMYLKLYKEGSPPDAISWSYPEMVQGFTSGMTAMLIQDPEVIVTSEENMEEGTWDTAPIPKGPSGFAQQPAGTAGWGIGAYSKHKEEAWKLVEFLSSPEQNLHFSKNNSIIPIHLSAGDDPYFKEGYFSSYIEMNAKPEEFLIAERPVEYQGYAEFRAIAEKDIQAFLLDKMSIDDTLSKWSEYWKKQKEDK